MTLRDIVHDVARRCGKNVTQGVDPETRQRLIMFVNDRYRELLRIPGIIELRDEAGIDGPGTPAFTFASTIGANRYALPPVVSSIVTVRDTTHGVKLQQRSLAWVRERDIAAPGAASGTPTYYTVLNYSGVPAQAPTTDVGYTVVSNHVGDVGIVVTLEYQAGNNFGVAQGTLNGATPVLVPLPAPGHRLFRVALDTTAQGQVQVLGAPSGVEVCRVPPSQLTSATSNLHTTRGWVLWLWPTPAGINHYSVDGARQRTALVNDLDEPLLPEDFHTLLVWGGCEDELIHMDDNRAGQFAQRWQRDIGALRAFLHHARGERMIPTGGRGSGGGWSPLGPNYPASYE